MDGKNFDYRIDGGDFNRIGWIGMREDMKFQGFQGGFMDGDSDGYYLDIG